MIFHITTKDDWLSAKEAGTYQADSLESEGFIHCSTRFQVLEVARARFQGRQDLVLLQIEESLLEAPLRYENLEGGKNLFPHLYGSLPVTAITQVHPFTPDEDGHFHLPEPSRT